MTTLTAKIAGALSIFLTFTVLERVGYKAGAGIGNSHAAIRGLEIASIAGPAMFVLLGAVCLVGYKLGPDRHADIRRRLEIRDAEADPSPGARPDRSPAGLGESVRAAGRKNPPSFRPLR